MAKHTIELESLRKSYRERSIRQLLAGSSRPPVSALEDVSLTVDQGQIFGLLGPNGAGKTTLIKILATLILPDSGRASLCGFDLLREGARVRGRIGLVNTNQRSFYWRLDAWENLVFYASLYNLDPQTGRKRIRGLLDALGLAEKAGVPFMKYSAGQQQCLALARALLPDPPILLMDEPTNSLDPNAKSEFRSFVRHRLAAVEGKTILWCTHDLREASELCDRLAILQGGRIRALGSLEEMRALLGSSSRFRLRLSNLPAEVLQRLDLGHIRQFRCNGQMQIELSCREDVIPALIERLVASRVEVYACERLELELEEVFHDLTRKTGHPPS